MIAVGASLERRIDETMARHGRHGLEHTLVADVAVDELLLDHAAARGRVEVARLAAGVAERRHFSSFHSSMIASAASSVRSSRSGVTEMNPSWTAKKSVPSRGSHTGSSPPIQ